MSIKLPKLPNKATEFLEGGSSLNSESGSLILLSPMIAVLSITLASLLIDINYLYIAQAALQNRVEVTATAATNNLDTTAYYTNSVLVINPSSAQGIANYQLDNFSGHDYHIENIKMAVNSNAICIDATASVNLPAFGAILGAINQWQVRARSIATLASGLAGQSENLALSC